MSANPVYFRISENEPLPEIGAYRPFKCVVVIQSPPSPDWQDIVSEWLVANGCLYMMAWGDGCSSWDDSVDYANLEAWEYGNIPDEHFVMTTWHENEPLEDVFGFARVAAWHADVELKTCLLLDIGPTDREVEMLSTFCNAWTD